MRCQPPEGTPTGSPDALIARLAAGQHAAVKSQQLIERGVPRWAIDNRVRNGRLIPRYRGVYLVPSAVMSPLAEEMAAVLACGPHAALSHGSAARVLGLPLPRATVRQRVAIDVSVAGSRRLRPGIRLHRPAQLLRREVAESEGVPITHAARTIVDVAPTATDREVERMLAEAHRELRVPLARFEEQLRFSAGRPGVGRVRRVLERSLGPRLTRSGGEELLLATLTAAGLDPPETNARVAVAPDGGAGSYEVDALWRELRVVVEFDSFSHHSDPFAFTADRRKLRTLRASGWVVLPFSGAELANEPGRVQAEVGAALTRAGAGLATGSVVPKR